MGDPVRVQGDQIEFDTSPTPELTGHVVKQFVRFHDSIVGSIGNYPYRFMMKSSKHKSIPAITAVEAKSVASHCGSIFKSPTPKYSWTACGLARK